MAFLRCIFCMVMVVISPLFAISQTTFKVELPAVVAVDDTFSVIFKVNTNRVDVNIEDFESLNFQEFEVITGPYITQSIVTSFCNFGSDKSMMTNFVNFDNAVQSTTEYRYVLKAVNTGIFLLGGSTVTVDDKQFTTTAIQVKVLSAAVAKNELIPDIEIPDSDIYVSYVASKDTVYKGEALLTTLLRYRKDELLGVSNNAKCLHTSKSLNGYYRHHLPSLGYMSSDTLIDQFDYAVDTLEQALIFPCQAGVLEVSPVEQFSTIYLMLDTVTSYSDEFKKRVFGDLYGTGSNLRSVDINKKMLSLPFDIVVKELPEDKPSLFQGAIGTFDVDVKLSKDTTMVNEQCSVIVTISGVGNLVHVTAPKLELEGGFEVRSLNDEYRVDRSGYKVIKSFEYPFVFTEKGTFYTPSIEFSYFDLSENRYKTIITEPLSIEVQ